MVRTRYPAMVHDCGDTIKPGDCVLLRAGSKKNELPYVAKVASLWENPEDGRFLLLIISDVLFERTSIIYSFLIHNCQINIHR